MKKITAVLVGILLAQGAAFAADPGTPEYQRIAEYKKQQRELHEKEKANPNPNKGQGFWAREASRSGFAGTGAMLSGAVGNVIPLDKPNSGKK